MLKFFLFSFFLLLNSEAGESSYQAGIAHLVEYVKTTKCQYIRNGDSHDGPMAAKHIKSKYDYFKDKISSAENFIRLSATKSTISGSKYYIKCAGSEKVESANWLLHELHSYRNKKGH